MKTIQQSHTGSGDNVRDKIFIQIRALAPSDLLRPIEMVFESIRKNDRATAKIQMMVLKATAQRAPEVAALVEVISIYGDLVEAEDHSAAWRTVSNIAASATDDIIKDVCLAALLRLSYRTEREGAAKEHYLAEAAPRQYAKEAFLCYYADEAQLEAAGRQFVVSEGELTGVVEGALRLGLTALAKCMAERLSRDHKSYNATVLLVMATAAGLNDDLVQQHLWLNLPEVKQRLDDLTAQVVELLDQSGGTDVRLYNMACPILETYGKSPPKFLVLTLNKYLQYLEPSHPRTAARLRSLAGDDSALPEWQQEMGAAMQDPQKRTEWYRSFLAANHHTLGEVTQFVYLATPVEIGEWLSKNIPIDNASALETAFARLFAQARQNAERGNDRHQRYQLAGLVDNFVSEWGAQISDIMPEHIFELANRLFVAELSDKAVKFTSRLIPNRALWPSPFVLEHLRYLLEAQQYKTFDDVIARVAGAETSLSVRNLQSAKAELLGDIPSAIAINDHIVDEAPDTLYCWYRGCYLRNRYQSEVEQRDFQEKIPDSLLQQYSSEAVAILYFLAAAGNFKRAEPLWVEWFIEDPKGRAIELVNFHFGLLMRGKEPCKASPKLEKIQAAFQFEQDGHRMVKLIVGEHQDSSEYTLNASSQLAKLLQSLPVGEHGSLGMSNYRVEERLPPYVACFRIALQLRNIQNDGSDSFAMLRMPSDAEQFVPYLEEKLGRDGRNQRQLGKIDNIPLYVLGHALYPENAFKGALNCWADAGIPKSLLWAQGDEAPSTVVLDAYGIGYLAVTDLVQRLLDIGLSLVVTAATKEALSLWIEEISDENFMMVGVTEAGRLFRTTAADIQARDEHTLRGLRLILDKASVVHPVLHDTALDIYSIKEGIDSTVYGAMQLSLANNIPWFCMDKAFGSLHSSKGYATANVTAVVARAMASSPFDFEHKRHGLLRYALGALPLPLTYAELLRLAVSPHALAGFILFKIIQNHGHQIFAGRDRLRFLLDVLFWHINSRVHPEISYGADFPSSTTYSSHVLNYGIRHFLAVYKVGTVEFRLANAMMYLMLKGQSDQLVIDFFVNHFTTFAEGHFMDSKATHENLSSLLRQMDKLTASHVAGQN